MGRNRRHKKPIDTLFIHINHFNTIPLSFEVIGLPGNPLQNLHHTTCKSVITNFLLNTKDIPMNQPCKSIEATLANRKANISDLKNHLQILIR